MLILINYLDYSLNEELNTDINPTFLKKKYSFAIDFIKDLVSFISLFGFKTKSSWLFQWL